MGLLGGRTIERWVNPRFITLTSGETSSSYEKEERDRVYSLLLNRFVVFNGFGRENGHRVKSWRVLRGENRQ